MPAWREEGSGLEVPCLGREKERLSGGNDSAQAKVRIQECLADQVCAVKSWVVAGRGWVGKDRVGGGIFVREERVGEVIDGVGDAGGPCFGDKDMVATIVKKGRGDVETPNAVMVPQVIEYKAIFETKVRGVGETSRKFSRGPLAAVDGVSWGVVRRKGVVDGQKVGASTTGWRKRGNGAKARGSELRSGRGYALAEQIQVPKRGR